MVTDSSRSLCGNGLIATYLRKKRMDNKEYIIIGLPSKKKIDISGNKLDMVFIAIPIILIILFPTGLVNYLCGRFNIHFALVFFGSLFGTIGTLFTLFIVNVVRIIRKNSFKKRLLILFEICLPILFFFSFFLFRLIWDSKDPFLCGYRDQITKKINIEEVQAWLKTFSEEHFNTDTGWINRESIPEDEYPESLKKMFRPTYHLLRTGESDQPVIDYNRGGGFFHWGFVIGTEDMVYPISEIMKERDEIWMLVQPGFYVYSQY